VEQEKQRLRRCLETGEGESARLRRELEKRTGELDAARKQAAALEQAVAVEQQRRTDDLAQLEEGHKAREGGLQRAVQVAKQDAQTTEMLAAHRVQTMQTKVDNTTSELQTALVRFLVPQRQDAVLLYAAAASTISWLARCTVSPAEASHFRLMRPPGACRRKWQI
jgi:predicted nuclease with TOPRIM domain